MVRLVAVLNTACSDKPNFAVTFSSTAEIISYADKYRKKTNLTTTSLDAQQLGLEKSFFPERMWTTYFDPKQKVKGKWTIH